MPQFIFNFLLLGAVAAVALHQGYC
jgi:hypothetical protein